MYYTYIDKYIHKLFLTSRKFYATCFNLWNGECVWKTVNFWIFILMFASIHDQRICSFHIYVQLSSALWRLPCWISTFVHWPTLRWPHSYWVLITSRGDRVFSFMLRWGSCGERFQTTTCDFTTRCYWILMYGTSTMFMMPHVLNFSEGFPIVSGAGRNDRFWRITS